MTIGEFEYRLFIVAEILLIGVTSIAQIIRRRRRRNRSLDGLRALGRVARRNE